MNSRAISSYDSIIEPMIALAQCSKLERILIAGAKSVELMLELQRHGYVRAASTANCGQARQYDVALVDWRQRTLKALERTLEWLPKVLAPAAVLVVWADPQKPDARQELCAALERRGFTVEAETVRDHGFAVSARRREAHPIAKRPAAQPPIAKAA